MSEKCFWEKLTFDKKIRLKIMLENIMFEKMLLEKKTKFDKKLPPL